MVSRQRRRRWRLTAALLLASGVAVVLALQTTGWLLLVLTVSVPAAVGAWLGLSDEELLDVLGGGDSDPDPGRGAAGWAP